MMSARGRHDDPSTWLADFDSAGFVCLEAVAAAAALDELAEAVAAVEDRAAAGRAGRRNLLRECELVREIACSPAVRQVVEAVLGPRARCVRALWFDKTPSANWRVTWHQDLMVAVDERHDVPGCGAWSVKQGVPHVQPPASVLQTMVTLRLHVDDCDADNGPLRVLPGSHRAGIADATQLAALREAIEPVDCCLGRGGAVLMRPLLVHSSGAAVRPRRRRVLHLEFAAGRLPAPLTWYDWV